MEGREIRRRFVEFFEQRGHRHYPSSSLIPNDPSLLLTTAGMVQFKPYFLGLSEPPSPRAVSVQKSFRTTDIDQVGHTARHLTFFEMLGNFSFGDYFKREAISYAWELVTEGYGIDPGRLWATVFVEDDEAAEAWLDYLPAERIVRRDRPLDAVPPAERSKFDNFWSMGVAGPCGPCSEIFVDRGPEYGPEGGPAIDEERFLEIWNLVFMQYERDDDFNIVGELAKKGVDTGSGLERVAVVLQGVDSAFDTDLLRPMVAVAEELSDRRYGEEERADVSLRILAEHGRATSFLIADGVLPSNEGRGYVLRRMLRRLVTHARRLGIEGRVTGPLVQATIETLGQAYPELEENRELIGQVASSEEERFAGTLRLGMALLEEEVERARPTGVLPGDVAFRLHDTHGFPLELTVELAADEGLAVDTDRFAGLMEDQRRRAQAAARKGALAEEVLVGAAARAGRTEFVGYERLTADARILAVVANGVGSEAAVEGQEARLLLTRTPFYAEAGGQVGDQGIIRTASGIVRVTDARWGPGDVIVHLGRVESGEVRSGDEAHAEVDAGRREATARSHTATHVVHWTLRHLLGEHARQAGSLVAPGRLRFDFTHHSALSRELLEEAEEVANGRLAEDAPVRAYETTLEFAKSQGAIALFGEKYGDLVRVVEVGDYSRELCGGTHVPHTGMVALVRMVSEASIGSGLRRIEALVGPDAIRHVNLERRLLEEVVGALGGGDPREAPERVRRAMERIKQLESELGKVRRAERAREVERLAGAGGVLGGISFVGTLLGGEDADGLRELAQAVRRRLEERGGQPAVVVLGNADGGRALLVAATSESLVGRGITAPRVLQRAARIIGGGAGGRPTLAFAGGGKGDEVKAAVQSTEETLRDLLRGG